MYALRSGLLCALLLLLVNASQVSYAQSADQDESLAVERPNLEKDIFLVTVADPFIELHTGPSAGYPIFHVVERGERVRIIRQRTDWFKIETDDDKTGWVYREQMRQTLTPDGEGFELVDLDEDDFSSRKWVVGVTGGEFDAAPVFTIFGGYFLTENLAAEVHFGQSVGTVSSSRYLKGNLVMQPFPDFSYSPYMTLGVGRIEVSTSSTLIAATSDDSNFAQVGLGIQTYVSRSFLFRFEFNEYVVFSTTNTRNRNEVVDEWKFGFAVFF